MERQVKFPILGNQRRAFFQSLELAGLSALLLAGAGRAEIPEIELTEWAKGFDHPVWIEPYRGDFLVVNQPGWIRLVPAAGGAEGAMFLNIKERVNYGGEKGLLGLALHPQFAANRRLFVNYTTGEDGKDKPRTLRTRISEFQVAEDLKSCDPAGEKVLLEYDQPFSNHNGGQVGFGPDGYLYIGNGDGGAGNDPKGNGQNLAALLGKFLRIDVDRREGDKAYAIPKDNPFVGKPDARPEIYSLGWRNPWRWSFDRKTGELWAGDVGQNAWEEVDLVEKGGNYGWRIMEGFHCTPKVSPENCDQTGLALPVVEYPRSQGVSVTGGYVYRGRKFPALDGVYLYGDFGSRRIWGLRQEGGKVKEQRELILAPQALASFGQDADGELFVVGHHGTIWRVIAK